MPNCIICDKETPVTEFYLVRYYQRNRGWMTYFCSAKCLADWVVKGMKVPYSSDKEQK